MQHKVVDKLQCFTETIYLDANLGYTAAEWDLWLRQRLNAQLQAGIRAHEEKAADAEIAGIVLRHQAKAGEARPELSGHYHPKVRLRLRQRHIARPCGVLGHGPGGADRLILPAFGALTGGMDASDPAIVEALQPARRIDALLPAGGKLVQLPLWHEAA